MRQQIIEAIRLATKNWNAHYFLPLSNTIGSRRRGRSFPHALQLACNFTTLPRNNAIKQNTNANTEGKHEQHSHNKRATAHVAHSPSHTHTYTNAHA